MRGKDKQPLSVEDLERARDPYVYDLNLQLQGFSAPKLPTRTALVNTNCPNNKRRANLEQVYSGDNYVSCSVCTALIHYFYDEEKGVVSFQVRCGAENGKTKKWTTTQIVYE